MKKYILVSQIALAIASIAAPAWADEVAEAAEADIPSK